MALNPSNSSNLEQLALKGLTSRMTHYIILETISRSSTQPRIPPALLNRVPASAGVKAGKSSLPGGR